MASPLKVSPPQKKALAVATVIALLFGAYFLRHYVVLIMFAAVMAFLFNPFYKARLRRHSPGRAATDAFLFSALVVLIPLALVVVLTALQINQTINHFRPTLQNTQFSQMGMRAIDAVNQQIAQTPISYRLTPEWVQETAISFMQRIGSALMNNLGTYAGSFVRFFTAAIIYIYVFLSLLKNQKRLLELFRGLNPLGDDIANLYLRRVAAMTDAMVRGQFIIAVAQGFTDALLIFVGGVTDGFFFLFVIMSVLSFIPLGGGILAIPIGIVMVLTGNVIGGLVVIAGHLLIVTNIDNILRPMLVPAEAKLDSALTILSVFSGIALLGFLGIVIGPVIMVIIVTTVDFYLQVHERSRRKVADGAK